MDKIDLYLIIKILLKTPSLRKLYITSVDSYLKITSDDEVLLHYRISVI